MVTKDDLKKYVEGHWSLPQYETQRAIEIIGRDRCPLWMANDRVEQHLQSLIDNFLCDNLLENDWFNDQYDSVEELFWEIDI